MRRRSFNDRIQLIWLGEKTGEGTSTFVLPDTKELYKQIVAASTQLEKLISNFDISFLLPMISLINMARSANTPKRSVDPSSPAFIEYLTAIALKNTNLGFQRPSIRNALILSR